MDLGYDHSGVDQICTQSGTGNAGVACEAKAVWRTTSMGADLSWFTVDGAKRTNDEPADCLGGSLSSYDDPPGLCFILLNERISEPETGMTWHLS